MKEIWPLYAVVVPADTAGRAAFIAVRADGGPALFPGPAAANRFREKLASLRWTGGQVVRVKVTIEVVDE
jgi:hypothetical protein